MWAPRSEERLILVFDENAAPGILQAAQELAEPASKRLTGDGPIHPILSITSSNELSPIEYLHGMAPQVRRCRIDNVYVREAVRALEKKVVICFRGHSTAKLVNTMHKNYDLMMCEEFDF
jgi:hypothetical protein